LARAQLLHDIQLAPHNSRLHVFLVVDGQAQDQHEVEAAAGIVLYAVGHLMHHALHCELYLLLAGHGLPRVHSPAAVLHKLLELAIDLTLEHAVGEEIFLAVVDYEH